MDLDASIGPVDDATLIRAYRDADLFVHAGRVELEGMSVMEAMAAAKAVIVSDSPTSASRQFVDHPRGMFRDGDIGHLRAVIEYWLTHPRVRREEAERNRARAERFRHEHSVTRLAEIYRRTLA